MLRIYAWTTLYPPDASVYAYIKDCNSLVYIAGTSQERCADTPLGNDASGSVSICDMNRPSP